MFVVIVIYGIARGVYWLYKQDGFAKVYDVMDRRQKKVDFQNNLQKTLEDLQAEVAILKGTTSEV